MPAYSYTRAQMVDFIRQGKSILHGGKVISRVEDLPPESELIRGDAAAEKDLLLVTQARKAAIEREEADLKARIESGRKAAESPEPKPAEPKPPEPKVVEQADAEREAEDAGKRPAAFGPRPVPTQGFDPVPAPKKKG